MSEQYLEVAGVIGSLQDKVVPFHVVGNAVYDVTGQEVVDDLETFMNTHDLQTDLLAKCFLEDECVQSKHPNWVDRIAPIKNMVRDWWNIFEYCPERGLHYPHVTDPHTVMLSKVLYSDGTVEEANFDMTYYTGYGDPEVNQFNPANGRHIIAWLEEVE